MSNSKRSTIAAAAAVLLVGTMGATAASAAVIQFSQSGSVSNKGTLNYSGTKAPLRGATIGLDGISLASGDAPSGHGDSLSCLGCALTFNTGLNIQKGPSTWIFNTLGGNFQITGDAYALNPDGTIADSPIASGTLLSGAFDENQTAVYDNTDPTATLQFNGAGTDMKATGLLNYFGSGTDVNSMFTTVLNGSGDTTVTANGGFSTDLADATITNNFAGGGTSVPEPGSWAMFGLGLLLVGAGLRRSHRGGRSLIG